MELTYEVIDIPGWGYGYKVESSDGSVRVLQTDKPGVPGRVKMTRATAEQLAQELVAALSAPPVAE